MAAPTVADAAAAGSRWGELQKGPTQCGSPNGLGDALCLLVDTTFIKQVAGCLAFMSCLHMAKAAVAAGT